MSNIRQCLEELVALNGVFGAALGDWKNGTCLDYTGTDSPLFPKQKLALAIAVNTEVIRAKARAAEALGFKDKIEDITITLETQYHLMHLTKYLYGLFFYVAVSRHDGNLGITLIKLQEIEFKLKL